MESPKFTIRSPKRVMEVVHVEEKAPEPEDLLPPPPIRVILTKEHMTQGLSVLGQHPTRGGWTYLAFQCNDQHIYDISILQSYPLLLYVDISQNVIDNLSPLSTMSCLTQLDASNNKLTTCLQYFAPKHKFEESVGSSTKKSIGSLLTMANLSYNLIEVIDDLSHHPFLEVLMLSSNTINRISGIQSLHYLKTLDLSNNNIDKIEGLDHLQIQELNLSHNKLTSLHGLTHLSRLSVLDVSNNNITSLQPLCHNDKLYYLDASNNQINLIRQVEYLIELPWMRTLKLEGNSCFDKVYYRNRVIFRLPSLHTLDNMVISPDEKIRSLNLYHASEGDYINRQLIFKKYFENEEFKDYSPVFDDDELNTPLQ